MVDCIIVVPCFNEAQRLDPFRFREFADHTRDVAFLFVNDGSSDETLELLEALCDSQPGQFLVLDLKRNVGKAEAVRQGVLWALTVNAGSAQMDAQTGLAPNFLFGASPICARPAFVGYWDADLSTPLEAIDEFRDVLRLRPEIELLMGARLQLLGRNIERHRLRHYLGRCFATAASWTLGINVYDTQCGAKLFRVTGETATLFAAPFCSRWIFDVELLARMLTLKSQDRSAGQPRFIYEYPLRQWRDVAGSKLLIRDYLRASLELLKIAWRFRSGNMQAELDAVCEVGRACPALVAEAAAKESVRVQVTAR